MLLWIHFLLAGGIALFAAWSRRDSWSPATRRAAWLLAAAGGLAGLASWPGLLQAQKTLTALAMPAGALWLLLWAMVLETWRRRQHGRCAWLVVVLLLFTLAGNRMVASGLAAWLEKPFVAINPLRAGPFDVVVVLGGSTRTFPNGYTLLNSSGDRVMLAARLFHRGRTEQLVACGTKMKSAKQSQRDPADESRRIWRDLGIADEAILQIHGRNTREEIETLAQLAKDLQWQRVGLVTSAWHMRRALRLARGQGASLEPLPADFRSGQWSWHDFSLIPDAGEMAKLQFCAREVLAMSVGR